MNNFRLIGIVFLLVAALASCHRKQTTTEKRYPFTGRVVSIDLADGVATIENDRLPVMDAMTMMYTIKPASMLSQLAPGDSISADLIIVEPDDDNARNDSWLENVKVTTHAQSPPPKATAQRIPAPGDDVPDFSLTNQSGQRISLRQYRGKVLLVTFIYTRCPFPDFCPRMSSNFAEISHQLAANPTLAARTHLLSISFDPAQDTPQILRDYGFSVAHLRDPALFTQWEFAVPRTDDLPKIADFFGLIVKPEGGLITHNLSTTVVSPDGKIAAWYHGTDWQVSDLIKDATEALKASDASNPKT